MTTRTGRSFITRACVGCGREFQTQNIRRIRCRDECGRKRSSASRNGARSRVRAEQLPNFVGVDGEGITVGNEHRYVLLSVGDQSYHKHGAHLDFLDCMEFLYSCYDPSAVYIGYYLGYDFTQWMRTLPEERARMLLTPEGQAKRARLIGSNPTPFPVRYDGWEFDVMTMRRWKLRPEGAKEWMYICDVGGYFQMPFVKASDPNEWQNERGERIEIATPEEIEIIARGKAKRATADFDEEMITYNQAENAVLARMMTVMAGGLKDIGVSLNKTQWFGPGQAVQSWMKSHNTHTRDAVAECTPSEVMDLAAKSFFGGWFEITHHGHVPGTTYEYDINSAYPNIHSKLPCLLHGRWIQGTGKPPKSVFEKRNGWTLVQARVRGANDTLGAMLHRLPNGRVLRPLNTAGIYWLHELEAAERAGLVSFYPGFIEWQSWATYEPCACAPPMHELANLYKRRAAVGKNTPQGKSLKLIYNSAYGKTAQSVGNPRFANPIHASLITSGCRTMILDAIATHPEGAEAVVMVATDGVYFSSPHPELKQGKALGDWEGCERQNMCLVMPGVYWDDQVRNNRARAKIKSRGVNAQALLNMIDTFDEQFARFDPADTLQEWPKVEIPMGFAMITAKQAIARNDYTLCGHVQQNYVKKLSSNPSKKRLPPINRLDAKLLSMPHRLPRELEENTPYRGRFGQELRELHDMHISDDGLTMDASFAQALYEF